MQGREAKLDGVTLYQTIRYFLKKSHDEKLFNFTLKLSGSSFLVLIETLISARYYAKQDGSRPLAAEFENPQHYLEKATPDCGSFANGLMKFLTDIDSNLYKQPKYKTTNELQTFIKEKKIFPYMIHLSVPGHIYAILVTHQKDGKPQGYIYQTNTAQDMGGEKFSIQLWANNKKNKAIDVLEHLSCINILLEPTQCDEQKKKTYEMLFTIPISSEVITVKNLDKLISKDTAFIHWNVGMVTYDALDRLLLLYQKSVEEMDFLKKFFDITLQDDFVTMFSEKLQRDEITLEEEPDLETALKIFREKNSQATKTMNLLSRLSSCLPS